MKAKLKLWTGWDSVRRLVRCIFYLGPSLGWRYYKLERYAMAYPLMVPLWCDHMRIQADVEECMGNELEASALRKLAQLFQDSNAAFHSANVASEGHLPAATDSTSTTGRASG